MATSAPGKLVDDTVSPHSEPPLEACKPDEVIEFVEPLPKEYECPLCLGVLKDPTQTNCGHHFCRPCIGRITQAKGPCPVCKTEGIQVFPDVSIKRKINALQVQCNVKSRGCPWVGELTQLGPHLKGDCGFVEVDCDFSDIGCTTKIYLKDVPQHREENVHKHLVLMVVRGSKSGGESEQRLQEQRAELIQKELQKKDEQIKSLQQQTTLLQQQANRIQKDKDEQIKSLQERVHVLEVYSTPSPPFQFVMTEFSKHKANNTEWFSPPFYSHPGGYKQCLAVFANGYEGYKGAYLSYVLCTMQGEYNDTLTWPKDLRVDTELFNHNTCKWKNTCGTCQSTKRKKPTTPRESCGCWHSICHTDLAPYLKNDCLLFRIARVVTA